MNPKTPILVIGSDASFCYLMQRYVTQSAHAAVIAHLGDDIIGLALRESPVAILLEADPHGNQSGALLEMLREQSVTRDIPVVLCAWQGVEEEGWQAVADGYLPKPVLYKDFVEALAHIGVVAQR